MGRSPVPGASRRPAAATRPRSTPAPRTGRSRLAGPLHLRLCSHGPRAIPLRLLAFLPRVPSSSSLSQRVLSFSEVARVITHETTGSQDVRAVTK